jgi:hypothetical protein
MEVQGTADCNRQIFSLADCPKFPSVEERANDAGNDAAGNDDAGNNVGNDDGNDVGNDDGNDVGNNVGDDNGNGLNIEPQIPSVIPFP